MSNFDEKLKDFMQTDEFKKKSLKYEKLLILCEKIYGRRKDLKLSQSDLAKRAGTTQRIISQLENGSYCPSNGIGEELYDKLAKALEIDRDYLFSEKIDRRTFELFVYMGEKLNWKWDIMQFMKLPYFIDLNAVKDLGHQITNFKYIRYEYGPFDKNIYTYRTLFENKEYKEIHFSYIDSILPQIDATLAALPITSGEKLKALSYKTKPMQKLKATPTGKEGWMQELDLKGE
jgi:transcriptional regulator with XRE-family HTH domain